MQSKQERFMHLEPWPYKMQFNVAVHAIKFFAPTNNADMRRQLNLPINDKQVMPLSIGDFMRYLSENNIADKVKDMYRIRSLLRKMCEGELLVPVVSGGPVLFGDRYYSLFELTEQQRKNRLWLAGPLGIGCVQELLKDTVVHITGKDDLGDVTCGTGVVISAKHILTCRHVAEINIDPTIEIVGAERKLVDKKISEASDIAILYLEEELPDTDWTSICLDTARVMDEALVMGYPPIPTSNDAYLVSQSAEINAKYDNQQGSACLILSSVTRPGTSGGPVFSMDGRLIGLVTGQSVNTLKSVLPGDEVSAWSDSFYSAYSADEIDRAIKEIDSEIDLPFEDYS